MSVSRDYKGRVARTKNDSRQQARRRASLLVFLLSIGIVGGLLGYLGRETTAVEARVGTEITANGTPIPSVNPFRGQAAAEKERAKPKYTFYQTLEDAQVPIPGFEEVSTTQPPPMPSIPVLEDTAADAMSLATTPATAAATTAAGNDPVMINPDRETPTGYVLQAGAFVDIAGAERVRANLALLGIDARVEQAQVRGTTINRVRLGPFSDQSRAQDILRRAETRNIAMDIIKKYD